MPKRAERKRRRAAGGSGGTSSAVYDVKLSRQAEKAYKPMEAPLRAPREPRGDSYKRGLPVEKRRAARERRTNGRLAAALARSMARKKGNIEGLTFPPHPSRETAATTD